MCFVSLWSFYLVFLFFWKVYMYVTNAFKQPHLNNFKLRSSVWEAIKIMAYLMLTHFEDMEESTKIIIKKPSKLIKGVSD